MKKVTDRFNAESCRRLFVRQEDDYSCAAATCATLARLCGLPPSRDYVFFRDVLKPDPVTGSDHEDIVSACKTYLPVTHFGTMNADYSGGVAFGYIVHRPTGLDHAVAFLARQGNDVIYYDPLDDRVYIEDLRHLPRATQKNDPTAEWTANMPPVPGISFEGWKKIAVAYPAAGEKQNPALFSGRRP